MKLIEYLSVENRVLITFFFNFLSFDYFTLTEVELSKILKTNRIYIDNQDYLIASSDYSETTQGFYYVKFSLESITF